LRGAIAKLGKRWPAARFSRGAARAALQLTPVVVHSLKPRNKIAAVDPQPLLPAMRQLDRSCWLRNPKNHGAPHAALSNDGLFEPLVVGRNSAQLLPLDASSDRGRHATQSERTIEIVACSFGVPVGAECLLGFEVTGDAIWEMELERKRSAARALRDPLDG